MTSNPIADNITKVAARIRTSAQMCDRDPMEITLLAVTKTRAAPAIRQAFAAGLSNIGENYLQEALDKQAQLSDLNLCWHFIGPIQSNKTRAIAENFDWVHSVDRLKIARRLNEQRPTHLPPLNLCLQVNISGEASKSGVGLEQLDELVNAVMDMKRLHLRGLMSIPQATTDPAQQRAAFASLRQAMQRLPDQQPPLDTLSMGMSADMEAAITEGSTLVRVGTDIFGPRS
jgi:pyridoxal phosphate enzyme (YggS family)